MVGEQCPECEHRPEVGDKARSENHLAHRSIAESALDHHCIHDSNRGRRQSNSRNLRLMYRPAKNELRNKPNDSKRHSK